MPGKLTTKKLKPSELSRYRLPVVVDHLASNYVMGTLSLRARKRVDAMRGDIDYHLLDERIFYWEKYLSPLDEKTPELQPRPQTWQNIQKQLGMAQPIPDKKQRWFDVSSLSLHRWASALSLMLVVAFGIAMLQKPETTGAVSYVAVLADESNTPQVVATSYADSRALMLNILSLPSIAHGKTFELWVTSKTDGKARSLGEIPISKAKFSRTLTKAEWGLIKDSDSLLISIEHKGGSTTGGPSTQVVSSGLCIRLTPWKTG